MILSLGFGVNSVRTISMMWVKFGMETTSAAHFSLRTSVSSTLDSQTKMGPSCPFFYGVQKLGIGISSEARFTRTQVPHRHAE